VKKLRARDRLQLLRCGQLPTQEGQSPHVDDRQCINASRPTPCSRRTRRHSVTLRHDGQAQTRCAHRRLQLRRDGCIRDVQTDTLASGAYRDALLRIARAAPTRTAKARLHLPPRQHPHSSRQSLRPLDVARDGPPHHRHTDTSQKRVRRTGEASPTQAPSTRRPRPTRRRHPGQRMVGVDCEAFARSEYPERPPRNRLPPSTHLRRMRAYGCQRSSSTKPAAALTSSVGRSRDCSMKSRCLRPCGTYSARVALTRPVRPLLGPCGP
jgi:hypothetical protein